MKKLNVLMGLILMPIVLSTGAALLGAGPNPAPRSEELRGGGLGRPETITGTIVLVVPEERLVVLAVQKSPDEKMAIEEPSPNAGDGARTVKIVRSGQTDFAFRITASSWIRAGGERLSVSDLAGLTNQRATVRFVPRYAGNFVESIDIG